MRHSEKKNKKDFWEGKSITKKKIKVLPWGGYKGRARRLHTFSGSLYISQAQCNYSTVTSRMAFLEIKA